MYNIKFTDYVPEPKPVKSDYIVAAHYYAAWKKGKAELHNGFDDLHTYPERTPLAGYYDEEDPRYTDWEIKWAVEHGINCFIHCWYRYRHNMGKPVTPDDLRCAHALHEGLFNAKYQNYINFAIMYEAQYRWGGTDKDDMLDNLMPFWTEYYFKRDNYLKIDNKPVLFIYDTGNQIKNGFASADEQRETFDKCREYAIKAGFNGLIIAAQNEFDPVADASDFKSRGYDFRFNYNYYYKGDHDFPDEEFIIKDQYNFFSKRVPLDPGGIPTASCFFDAEPRFSEAWNALGFRFATTRRWYLSPDNFRRVIANCRELTDSLPESNPGRKMIMIDNWNEWDEGHFVAPSHQFGFRFLQAIREELTHRDNLPDYRMPQDIGLSNFNNSWDVPDMTEICRKKFGVK